MIRPLVSFALVSLLAHTAFAQPQALPAEQLKKIKAATVFVKVRFGSLEGSGSGFVVHATKDSGIIVTNQHVIAPPTQRPQQGRLPGPPRLGGGIVGSKATVEVVFNSGTPTEWSVKAETIYENKTDDLALLKVRAVKPIPEPLGLTGADRLPETTPVYVCGFPFGDALATGDKNPEISIGQASVSSNRTDDRGNVVMVQLNGALNPGNSGGPVLTQDGKLVGVAVQTITGAGIGFAVPPSLVRKAIDEVHFTVPVVSALANPPKTSRLSSKMVDALGRLKSLEVHVAPAPTAVPPGEVAKLPNAAVTAATVTAESGAVTAQFPTPDGTYFWVQFVWTDANGNVSRNAALRFPAGAVSGAGPVTARPSQRPPQPLGGATAELDGKPLPPLARDLGITPNGQMDVDELNRRAKELTGREMTIDVLTVGSSAGWGDGPSLSGFNRNKQMPGGLDFVVSRPLADAITSLGIQGHFAVRLKGTVQRSPSGKPWELFVVDEINLIGTDGTIAATLTRANANAIVNPPPQANPQPRATPEAVPQPRAPNVPAGGVANPPFQQPEIVPNPDPVQAMPPRGPLVAPPVEEGSNTGLLIGVGVAVFVLIGGIATWAVLASKKPTRPVRSTRSRSGEVSRRRPPVARRDREEDDDDEDDRPRRRSRRDD